MPTASIRLARSWKECGLNADMVFEAEFDPKRTSLPRMAHIVRTSAGDAHSGIFGNDDRRVIGN